MRLRRTTAAAMCAAVLLLSAGCGKDDDNSDEAAPSASLTASPSASASATSSPSAAPTASEDASASPSASSSADAGDGVTLQLELVDGKPKERPDSVVKVDKGETFTLVATSDKAYEIHIHGYDKKLELEPGEEGRVSFTADQTGDWAVEVEETGFQLFTLQVT